MSKPKRQHFIPKSYLKNFAKIEGDKAFVEAMNVHSGEIKNLFSINDICVSKNIYTIPNVKEEDKYFLEHFYANNVDGVYPEVYNLLTNDKVEKISEVEREKILSTTLSLYFRTSKFLNQKDTELKKVFDFIDNYRFKTDEQIITVAFGDKDYSFTKSEVEEIKETIKVNNKMDFILGHFKQWQDFVKLKYNSQITVCKVSEEVPLITCDNPVDIHNRSYPVTDIFDPQNSIQLPLNQHYFLWISPNSQKTERNIIYRGVRDKWFAITSNHTIQTNATDWIISKENSILNHLNQQEKYNKWIPENIEALDNIKTKSIALSEFVDFVGLNGGMKSQASLNKFNLLKQDPAFRDDPQFKMMSKEMDELFGYQI